MGLQSAMTTALTGLQAAETTIDITGNNVANSNTVGFKESDVIFATQFLRTLSIGSAPSEQLGGTNPRQIGLGVRVAEIKPNFTQGTVEISANPLDVAIQGDGFIILQGSQGEALYTRAGQLNTNAENQIVTPTGHRVLGYGIDEEFQLDTSSKVPLTIPLGAAAVAQATQNAFFTGTLTPTAEVGDTPEIIQSIVLGNGSIESPDTTGGNVNAVEASPPSLGTFSGADIGGGAIEADNYRYRFVFADESILAPPIDLTQVPFHEGPASVASGNIAVAANGQVDLQDIPQPTNPDFTHIHIYRTGLGQPNTYKLVGEVASGTTTFVDNADDAQWNNGDPAWGGDVPLNDQTVDAANYSYYVTFYDSLQAIESRPTPIIGPIPISNDDRRIRLDNFPTEDADSTNGTWDQLRIYRNVENESSSFYLVDEIDMGSTSYVDSAPDSTITGNPLLDLDGPKATTGTALWDLVIRDGANYLQPFANKTGTLTFAGRRGGRLLEDKELSVTSTTTVAELVSFMHGALGIHTASSLPDVPLPAGAGISMINGQMQVTSNMGIENAISIGLTAFEFRETGSSTTETIAFNFSQIQGANGEGATTDILVYDSLGIPISMRITTVIEAKDSNSTTYRWFGFSPDNEPLTGVDTDIGNGIIQFDSQGRVVAGDTPTVAIQRNDTASTSPLEIALNFDAVSGLASVNNLGESVSTLNVSNQDGFPPGVLTSFIVTESGLIRGVFSNGTERALGQMVMARFNNNNGLQALGDNLYATGVNSGEPLEGLPGFGGLGTLLGGAVELSNTDIGQNLISLILASTQYRGNARVITTAQELLDELLALRR